jgi:preprotein translocase subunit SecE
MSAGISKTFNPVQYLSEVREELKKVSWPSREQTIEKTTLVIVVSIFVGAYIGVLDFVFTQVMSLLVK